MSKAIEIKICGLTREEDAIAASKLGATSLGFIFAESSRSVEPAFVASLASLLPAQVRRIGVFRDAGLDEILLAVKTARINGVQLHGEEDAKLISAFKKARPEILVIKTLEVTEALQESEIEKYGAVSDVLLFDAPKDDVAALDIERLGKFKIRHRFWIAGKLNSRNVGRALDGSQAHGVDVASGVESQIGIKSQVFMKEFIAAVKEVGHVSR